tara:strand:+ start:1162 stop:2256 length:1095 start_codon:yes stop_codon:yes gene_type:complete
MFNKKKNRNVMKRKSNIILSTGGSGGHVFPAIAISDEMKKLKIEHSILTDKRCEKFFSKRNIPYKVIHSSSIQFNPLSFFISILKISAGLIQSLIYIQKLKPLLLIGFGGYSSVPTIIAARILRISTGLHEQNAVMGKANRFLSNFTEFDMLSYKKTKFSNVKKSIYTGMPVRNILVNSNINNNNNSIKVLVLGGSQGARIFSKIIPQIIDALDNRFKKKIILVQQSRTEDIKNLKDLYSKMGIKFKLKSFFNNIFEEMLDSKFIISRCGSSTLSEIELVSRFSILFPLPGSKDNHQYENAKQFSRNNKCLILDEKKMSNKSIIKSCKNVFLNPNYYTNFSKLNTNFSPTNKFLRLIKKKLERK